MKKLIVIGLVVLGLAVTAKAQLGNGELNKAQRRLAEHLNAVIEATYDQGFIDGYQAGERAAKKDWVERNKTHS